MMSTRTRLYPTFASASSPSWVRLSVTLCALVMRWWDLPGSAALVATGVIPAMFGNAMAAYVLSHLAGQPTVAIEPLFVKNRERTYTVLWNRIAMKERDRFGGRCGERATHTLDVRTLTATAVQPQGDRP
jgi:hypothetical protein